MEIWVDADACPVAIKEILYRAAKRTGTMVTLVANQFMRIPQSPYIRFILVGAGSDVADKEIVEQIKAGDLVITSDIPLAAKVVEKEATALNSYGELYTRENVAYRLSIRDFMENLRGSGIETEGPPPMSQKNRQLFANNLDKWLNNRSKNI